MNLHKIYFCQDGEDGKLVKNFKKFKIINLDKVYSISSPELEDTGGVKILIFMDEGVRLALKFESNCASDEEILEYANEELRPLLDKKEVKS